jgi:hypothetical protein
MQIYRLEKKRARTSIIFDENLEMDSDGWFVDIKKVNKKDDKLKSLKTIIKKDIDTWLNSYISDGWYINENEKKIK